MPLVRRYSPALDSGPVAFSGGAKERHITISGAEYSPPFWVRLEPGNRVHRVDALPWRAQGVISSIDVLSSDPNALSAAGRSVPAAWDVLSSAAALYPNRPNGLTQVTSFPGFPKRGGTGGLHAFGDNQFGNWGEHNNESDIQVVTDATNPIGSGQALRIKLPADDSTAGTAVANTFTGGPYKTLYIMWRVFLETGGFAGFGNKFFYWGAAIGSRANVPGSPTQFYNDRPGGANFRIINQNSSPDPVVIDSDENPPLGNNSNPLVAGQWLNIEQLCYAESVPGAGDGRMYVWINGVLIGSDTSQRWLVPGSPANGFTGLEWYGEVNSVPVDSYYRIGELYIAGGN